MNILIKYTDEDGNYVTEQQVSNLIFYKKEYYIENELRKIERHGPQDRTNKNVILKGGEYYLSPEDNLQNIINQYSPTAITWTFWHNKQTNIFGDVYWEYLLYKNCELKSKGKRVFNNEKLLIASCTINIETNQVQDKSKFFYGDLNIYKRTEYDSYFLSVSYDTNNDIRDIYIYDDDYQSVDEFLSSYNSNYFDWMAHPYYHSFEPMLPSTVIV